MKEKSTWFYTQFKEDTKALPEPANHKPIVAAALLALSLLTSIYFVSHSVLEHKAKTVLLGHTVLANLDN